MVDAQAAVSAEKFRSVLIGRLRRQYQTDPQVFVRNYEEDAAWTSHMTTTIKDLCVEELSLEAVDTEWFVRLDVAAFDRCTQGNWDEWSLEVAVELENASFTWEQECHKLLLLSCGLKVLISYEEPNKERLRQRLKRFIEIYESRKYCRRHDEWLFFFMPWAQHRQDDPFVYSFSVRNRETNDQFRPELHEYARERLF